ncbi:MAG: Hpt domain-containing protein [Roseburia sp.]
MERNRLEEAGIDYAGALGRFVGKRELYERFLMKFVADTHAVEADRAFAEHNYAKMLEQTHALKGVAGTLGLLQMHKLAAEIVDDLRAGEHAALGERMRALMEENDRLHTLLRE